MTLGLSFSKHKMAWIDIKKAKTMGFFFLNHQYIFRFQDFFIFNFKDDSQLL